MGIHQFKIYKIRNQVFFCFWWTCWQIIQIINQLITLIILVWHLSSTSASNFALLWKAELTSSFNLTTKVSSRVFRLFVFYVQLSIYRFEKHFFATFLNTFDTIWKYFNIINYKCNTLRFISTSKERDWKLNTLLLVSFVNAHKYLWI